MQITLVCCDYVCSTTMTFTTKNILVCQIQLPWTNTEKLAKINWKVASHFEDIWAKRKTHLFWEARMSLRPSLASCTSSRMSYCSKCPEKKEEGKKIDFRERNINGVGREEKKGKRSMRFGHWILETDAKYATFLCAFVLFFLLHARTHAHTHTLTYTPTFYSNEWAAILLSVLRGLHLKGPDLLCEWLGKHTQPVGSCWWSWYNNHGAKTAVYITKMWKYFPGHKSL